MAVEDKYVNADVEAGKKAKAAFAAGAQTVTMIGTETIIADDDDGSAFRFFSGVPSNLIPVSIVVNHEAIIGGTDYDLGLYKVNKGEVIDINLLMNNETLATAGTKDGLEAVPVGDQAKTLAELSGQTDPDSAYDIVLTGNTVGAAGGVDITIKATFVQG